MKILSLKLRILKINNLFYLDLLLLSFLLGGDLDTDLDYPLLAIFS